MSVSSSPNIMMVEKQNPVLIYNGTTACCGLCCVFLCQHPHYYITTGNIEIEKGLCCRTIQNIEMIDVHDVEYHPGSCLFCCCSHGKIILIMKDRKADNIVIEGIKDAHRVQRALKASLIQQRETV